MDAPDIKAILQALGCERIGFRGTDWIQCSCPFSDFHKSLSDRHPSFAVRIDARKPSGWFCYTCKKRGRLHGLVGAVTKLTGRIYDQSLHDYAHRDGDTRSLIECVEGLAWTPAVAKVAPPPVPVVLDESMLSRYKLHSLESMLYLQGPKRRLTLETIALWALGWDDDDGRVVIPIRDEVGQLLGLSRRLVREPPEGKDPPKYLHSKGFKRDLVLFGEHRRKPDIRRGFVVEGFFDVIWLQQCGFDNALAIMGSYLSGIQAQKLKAWFEDVVIVADGDPAGLKMAEDAARVLRPEVKVKIVPCPPGTDPNDMAQEELQDLFSA